MSRIFRSNIGFFYFIKMYKILTLIIKKSV